MAKDKLGNRLNKGDLVVVTADGAPRMHGEIEHIDLGGMMVPVKVGNKISGAMTPGTITIIYRLRLEYDPSGDPHLDALLKCAGIAKDVVPETSKLII